MLTPEHIHQAQVASVALQVAREEIDKLAEMAKAEGWANRAEPIFSASRNCVRASKEIEEMFA